MHVLFGSSLVEPVDLEVYDGPDPRPEHLSTIATGAGPADLPRELGHSLPLTFGGQPGRSASPRCPPSIPARIGSSPRDARQRAPDQRARLRDHLLQTRALLRARRLGSEIQAADRRLRQANERFEMAASAVKSAIYDWSLRHGTVVWTSGLTEMCGYPLDEVSPTREWWVDRLHPDDRARVHGRSRRRGGGPRLRDRVPIPDPRRGHLEVQDRGRFVRDGSGRAVRMVGSMVDVSERRRAEAVLRESEARHRAMLDSAMDAVVGMDHEGRVTEFNPAAERMFGHARADVLGRDPSP